ncbi:MAG TPA: peptidoglycan-binding domain-containing protein [Candidatus Limiplasma sp.]|nr:peptidoglycan-binding domain-containing protein [Candidatus Limiplasma sp.]
MKKWLSLLLMLMVCSIPFLVIAQSSVPDELPADLGGKTLYGYLVDLKNSYLPAKVFQDAVKYSDQNREDAKQAAKLIVDATTAKMQDTGSPDQYMLYLRAYATDLLFQASGDEALRDAGLADYKQVVDLGGAYAQADYDKLAALEVKSEPLNWQIPQMLTLEEMATTLGVPAADLFLTDIGYSSADGNKTGTGYAYRKMDDPAASAIYVLADLQGGKSRYDVLKTCAFLQKTEAVSGIGDEAVLMGLRNIDNNPALYTTLLVRKDELVLQVRIPFAAWRGGDSNANLLPYAQAIATKVLENLYNTQRAVPSMNGVVQEDILKYTELDAGTADSPVPDAMPTDLGGTTEYGYIVNLRNTYLPASVYGNANLSATDLNNARRAAWLIVNILSERFDHYGQNPYELEIRAACYRFAYQDSGDPVFRALAINDYKQALNTGYSLGKRDYDALATPLLLPMAELGMNASGDAVTLLQKWLIQAQYMDVPATGTFDDATQQAVKRFESENGLTEDGIADIAFLLLIYSRIDDMDAPLP